MTRSFFSRYFGFEESVDRRMYLRTGIALMAVKYAIDAVAIHQVTGQIWTPANYLLPLITLKERKLTGFPDSLSIGLILWTLPFVWVGVSMTFRRAIDAGKSPWCSLLFFIPLVNYAVMLVRGTHSTCIPRLTGGRLQIGCLRASTRGYWTRSRGSRSPVNNLRRERWANEFNSVPKP